MVSYCNNVVRIFPHFESFSYRDNIVYARSLISPAAWSIVLAREFTREMWKISTCNNSIIFMHDTSILSVRVYFGRMRSTFIS